MFNSRTVTVGGPAVGSTISTGTRANARTGSDSPAVIGIRRLGSIRLRESGIVLAAGGRCSCRGAWGGIVRWAWVGVAALIAAIAGASLAWFMGQHAAGLPSAAASPSQAQPSAPPLTASQASGLLTRLTSGDMAPVSVCTKGR